MDVRNIVLAGREQFQRGLREYDRFATAWPYGEAVLLLQEARVEPGITQADRRLAPSRPRPPLHRPLSVRGRAVHAAEILGSQFPTGSSPADHPPRALALFLPESLLSELTHPQLELGPYW